MSRWAPGARGRLEQAAMELFAERGFEDTTVAEIAVRAGLTERSFFRHFADKREVLFSGAAALQQFLVDHVELAPVSLQPLDAITAALCAAADEFFEERREGARWRQAIIDAHAELQERELIKRAGLAAALAGTLRGRGISQAAAGLAAETGIAVFKIAFEQWVRGAGERSLAEHIAASVKELRNLAGRP